MVIDERNSKKTQFGFFSNYRYYYKIEIMLTGKTAENTTVQLMREANVVSINENVYLQLSPLPPV